MSKLFSQIKEAGVLNVSTLADQDKTMQGFCDLNEGLFQKVCEKKPGTSPYRHLLGLLTKSQIELTATIEAQSTSTSAMLEVISGTVGSEHRGKFTLEESKNLAFITHMWVYMQGRLNMDFSYANDHAMQTSTLLSPFFYKPAEELRCLFMESYYAGKKEHQIQNPKQGIWHSIKSLFSQH